MVKMLGFIHGSLPRAQMEMHHLCVGRGGIVIVQEPFGMLFVLNRDIGKQKGLPIFSIFMTSKQENLHAAELFISLRRRRRGTNTYRGI